MYFFAILLGFVEGLTEFLPVSSTGHMIIVGHMVGFTGPVVDTFEIFIQLGAILAVVSLYRERILDLIPGRRINREAVARAGAISGTGDRVVPTPSGGFSGWHGLGLLALTTTPAVVIGLFIHSYIKEHLFSPMTVAIGLAIGGVGLILIERFRPSTRKTGLDTLGWRQALGVGFFQCLAMWPGMSRAGSTIIGGMLMGIDRKTTAEYSFLAAVPVMIAATSYDLYKSRDLLAVSDIPMFALGFLTAMVTAWFAVRLFIRFLANHTLEGFGWYRLVLAAFTIWYFSSP